MTARRLAGAAALAAVLACTGCGEGIGRDDARRGGSIVVAHATAPESLDPALVRSRFAAGLARQAYVPPLVHRRGEGGEAALLAPGLAERMPRPSKGGRVYTFRIHAGLRYPSGRPLRARDFEHALVRAVLLNPRARRLYRNVIGVDLASPRGGIPGVSTDDRRRTVRIALERRDRLFPYALAVPWAAPVPSGTPVRDLSADPPPGIGPYRVARVRRGGDVVLVRRGGWRVEGVPAGNVEEIATVAIPNAARRTRAGIDGWVDVVEGEAPRAMLPDLRSKYQRRYRERPTRETLAVSFDHGRPPFNSEAARRAVALALDTSVLERIHEGFVQPSCNFLPPAIPGYEKLDPCPYGERDGSPDLIQASRLVEQAGLEGAPVRIARGGGPRERALTRYLARTLEKIGLRPRPAGRGQAAARIGFIAEEPAIPHPAAYLSGVGDTVLRVRTSLLAQEKDGESVADEWADIDRAVVEGAFVSPYGVRTEGLLTSERVDTELCLRDHPVTGVDYASICLR